MVNAVDVRELLEGYGIDAALVTDSWIDNRINNFIILWIEKTINQSFREIKETTEFHSGTGSQVLILDRRPIIELIALELVRSHGFDVFINLDSIEVIKDEGILKTKVIFDDYAYSRTFPKGAKNVKVTYTYGFATIPEDIKEAITYYAAEQVLGFLGSRTGGGDLNVVNYTRGYGNRGRYTHIRNDLARYANSIIKLYMTGVVGSG